MPRTSNCPLFPARDVDLVFRGQSTLRTLQEPRLDISSDKFIGFNSES